MSITMLAVGLIAAFASVPKARANNELHAARTVSKAFKLTSGAKISIETEIGNNHVDVYPGDSVKMEGVVVGKSEREIQNFKLDAHSIKNELKITGTGWENNSELGVSIIISVPQSIKLSGMNLDVGLGNVTVFDIHSGSIDMKTNAGDIWISRVSSDIRVHSNAGGLYMRKVSGDVNARLSAGNIIGSGLLGKVSARANAGQIEVSLDSDIKQARFTTDAGEIHIAFPGTMIANLSAETSGEAISGKLYGVYFTPEALFPRISFHGTIHLCNRNY